MNFFRAVFNFFKWILILSFTLFGLLIAAGIVTVYYEEYLKKGILLAENETEQERISTEEEKTVFEEKTPFNDEEKAKDESLPSEVESKIEEVKKPVAPPQPLPIEKSEEVVSRNESEQELNANVPPPPRFAPLKGKPVFRTDPEPPWYHFRFSYRDIMEDLYMWEWLLQQAEIKRSLSDYGLPKSFFQNYYDEEQAERVLKKGFFRYDKDGYISTDYNAVLRYYHKYTEPLYVLLKKKVGDDAPLTDYIEELLRFCQDIPYKRPGDYYGNKYIWDFYTPVHIMLEREGDCDSKSVLFASVLMHDRRFRDKIVYITVAGHLLLGIEGEPNPYQDWVDFQGKKYIVCDPVGPAHTAFGVSAWDYGPVLNIEKASLN